MNENRHDRMQPHKIDDLFRSAIEPSEELPAPGVWEGVEKKLDQYNLVNIKRKYNNLKGIAVALLLLCSAFLYELQTSHSANKNYNAGVKKFNNAEAVNSLSITEPGRNKEVGDNGKLNPPLQSIDQKQDLTKQSNDILGEENKNPANTGKTLMPVTGNNDQLNPFADFPTNTKSDHTFLKNNNTTDLSFNLPVSNDVSLFPASPSAVALLNDELYLGQLPDFLNIPSSNPSLILNNKLNTSSGLSANSNNIISLGRKKSRFSLTLMFSPDFTSRVIKSDWQINREDNRDEIRKSERYAFSYSFGSLVDYKINSHWAIESGLAISRAVINIMPKFIFARPDGMGEMKYKFNSSNGYSYISPKNMNRPAFGDSLNVSGSSSSLQYASLPVTGKYTFGKKKLNFNALAGIAANFLIKDKIETSLYHAGNHETEINNDIKGLKPVYYSGIVAVGASYNINKTFAVSLTPTARLALTSINKDTPVTSYQNSLGLVAGVQLNF